MNNINNINNNIIILLFVGLPGSGKTYVLPQIRKWCEEDGFEVQIIHFDAIESTLQKNNALERWQEAQRIGFEMVESALSAERQGNLRKILLVEDNLYYRSMRRNFFS